MLTGTGLMNSTSTAVIVGTAFGMAGVLAAPARIGGRIGPRTLRGPAIAFGPIALWLVCGGPILPTMLAFCFATSALGEWRLRGRRTVHVKAAGPERTRSTRRRSTEAYEPITAIDLASGAPDPSRRSSSGGSSSARPSSSTGRAG